MTWQRTPLAVSTRRASGRRRVDGSTTPSSRCRAVTADLVQNEYLAPLGALGVLVGLALATTDQNAAR